MTTKTEKRVYVVEDGENVIHLVRATSAHNAVMHIYAPTVRVATFEDADPKITVEDAK